MEKVNLQVLVGIKSQYGVWCINNQYDVHKALFLDSKTTILNDGGYNWIKTSDYEYNVPTKSIDDVAKEVIAGKWGNGDERKKRLTDAGYNYSEVQARVNELMNGSSTSDRYLNLKPTVSSWTVYKTNKYFIPSKTSDVLAKLNPKKFGGLSYKILEDCGNYHFKIKTDMFGYGYIAGNPNKYDCTITDKPVY